ncbi:PIG-L deacetylase family protein [Chitinophaga alhagiae]|uniref:PIG-L deacetylase family protein n=1 Tax=Chitinophaga alhagiae TaxID=2203219 RepID=UPI00130075CC|nr:PIG-L family deacetylase [Chitinophaga alhagiae]
MSLKCRLLMLAGLAAFNGLSAQVKTDTGKCIMVFGAHADDVDEIAGGTLAKYVAMGYTAVYVCMVKNLDGCSLERTPWFDEGPDFTVSGSPMKYRVEALETIQIREEEAKAAAAVYPAIPVFMDFREPTLYIGRSIFFYGSEEYNRYNPPGGRTVALATMGENEDVDVVYDLLKEYKPEIVITHTLGGEKMDHGNAAYLVYIAFKQAMANGVPVGKLWMPVNGWLLDEDAQASGKGKPDVRIDISQYLETKYKALNMHISQNGGLGRNYLMSEGVPLNEQVEEFITVIDNTN